MLRPERPPELPREVKGTIPRKRNIICNPTGIQVNALSRVSCQVKILYKGFEVPGPCQNKTAGRQQF
ncbi:hypothetical protein GCM10011323_32610 [Pontibacter amylolyticus]|uniref:Uncharacterized protein n=1 Tax=Pontibacter amylolyticus TaxID=1424080 RepID=A0ABQ1WDN4_9BACT|nr:hypothetical protein GCM10011323_32610 [Pontibacter amylolyticus]